MKTLAASLCLIGALAGPASAFEWDDGRGAFPFRPVTTRNYEAAKDLEHMRRFEKDGGRRVETLNSVSAPRPAAAQILRPPRPARSGARAKPPPPGPESDGLSFFGLE